VFTTAAQIKTDLAASLKLAGGSADLPPYWDDVVSRCHTAAYQEVVGALLARGFSKSVIDTWDRGSEFERSIALYFCATSPQGIGSFDLNAVKLWDKREDLKAVQVYTSGTAVDPSEQPGTVGSGRMNDQRGIFNPISQTGEDDNPYPMRW